MIKTLGFEKRCPFSDDDLDALERLAGWSLPREYRVFAKEYGGAFVGGLIDANSSLPILSFDSFSRCYRTSSDRSALPIQFPISFAHCELGNLWVFDTSGQIHYVNYYNRPSVSEMVAVDFGAFVGRIVLVDD